MDTERTKHDRLSLDSSHALTARIVKGGRRRLPVAGALTSLVALCLVFGIGMMGGERVSAQSDFDDAYDHLFNLFNGNEGSDSASAGSSSVITLPSSGDAPRRLPSTRGINGRILCGNGWHYEYVGVKYWITDRNRRHYSETEPQNGQELGRERTSIWDLGHTAVDDPGFGPGLANRTGPLATFQGHDADGDGQTDSGTEWRDMCVSNDGSSARILHYYDLRCGASRLKRFEALSQEECDAFRAERASALAPFHAEQERLAALNEAEGHRLNCETRKAAVGSSANCSTEAGQQQAFVDHESHHLRQSAAGNVASGEFSFGRWYNGQKYRIPASVACANTTGTITLENSNQCIVDAGYSNDNPPPDEYLED